MSKRVEVKAGDTWFVCNSVLLQQRGQAIRFILDLADSKEGSWGKTGWNTSIDIHWIENEVRHAISSERAKGYIVGSGGEWVEVAEEKPAKVVAHVSEMGAVYLTIEGSEEFKASEEANFRRITIAGVTT
jgi:hypothetical protein